MSTKEYNPTDHSIVQAFLKADACNRYEVPDFVEALLHHIKSELERVYWNVKQEQLDNREDWQFLEIPGFEYRCYCWGDCDCGFDELDHEWSEAHKHAPECYYVTTHALIDALPEKTEIDRLCKERNKWTPFSKESDRVQNKISAASKRKRQKETEIYKAQCAKYGISWNGGSGCAVHCTCGHDRQYSEWRQVNDHKPTCSPGLPNMRFGDVRINWYKHLGRGTSTNVDYTDKQWREWMDKVLLELRRWEWDKSKTCRYGPKP